MRLTGTEDLRVRRTIEAIKRAFTDLMGEKPYHRITVRELADRATINKKTFYYYYPSLDSLLFEMQDEILDRYMERVEKYGMEDLPECIREFFFFFTEQEPGIYRIVTHDKTGLLYKKFIALDERRGGAVKAHWDGLDDYSAKLLIAYLNMSILHSVKLWIEEGEQTTIERAIETATTLSLEGVNGILARNRARK